MQLDDLKEAWAAHGALLERSLAIDERLLRETLLRKVRFALAPYVVLRAVEVALGAGVCWAVVRVLAAHLAEPRYLVVGGALAAFTVGMTWACAYLLVSALQIDYGRPVTEIQRAVERLRVVEYRTFKWALLGGVLFWLPVLLVLFEALTPVQALGRVHLPWLVANLVLGLVVLRGADPLEEVRRASGSRAVGAPGPREPLRSQAALGGGASGRARAVRARVSSARPHARRP